MAGSKKGDRKGDCSYKAPPPSQPRHTHYHLVIHPLAGFIIYICFMRKSRQKIFYSSVAQSGAIERLMGSNMKICSL